MDAISLEHGLDERHELSSVIDLVMTDPMLAVSQLCRLVERAERSEDWTSARAARAAMSHGLIMCGRMADAVEILRETCTPSTGSGADTTPTEHATLPEAAMAAMAMGDLRGAVESWSNWLSGKPQPEGDAGLLLVGLGLAEAHLSLGLWEEADAIAATSAELADSVAQDPLACAALIRWRLSRNALGLAYPSAPRSVDTAGSSGRLPDTGEALVLHIAGLIQAHRLDDAMQLAMSGARLTQALPWMEGWRVLLSAWACRLAGLTDAQRDRMRAWQDLRLPSPGWALDCMVNRLAKPAEDGLVPLQWVHKLEGEDVRGMLKLLRLRLKAAQNGARVRHNQKELTRKRLEAASLQAKLEESVQVCPSLLSELIRDRVPRVGMVDVMDLGALGFHLAYQPFLTTDSMQVHGCEALIRLNHPSAGPMFPDQFIGRLETSGDIVEVGRWVVQQACAQIRRWRLSLGRPVHVAVNVAAKQLERPGFAAFVTQMLEHYQVPRSTLEVEVTESLAVNDSEQVLSELKALRTVGVSISVDDFGTGFCNLARVLDLQAQKLKVDKSLVNKLVAGDKERKAVGTLITSGLSMDMSVTAEGVETAQQARLLMDMRCTYLQGYLIGKPMPSVSIEPLFTRPAAEWANLLAT